jgi:hypothetical protein
MDLLVLYIESPPAGLGKGGEELAKHGTEIINSTRALPSASEPRPVLASL